MHAPERPLWARFAAVAFPVFTSECRGRAWAGLALLLGLLLSINGLNVVNSFVGRDCISALAERHAAMFYTMAFAWVCVFAASTVAEVLARYVEQRVGIVWREWLTRRMLDRYMADRTYCRLARREDVDNPDQRISEDVKSFTTSTLAFLVLLLNACLTLMAFAGVLWSITPMLFLVALAYAACGSLGTILIGRRLIGLDNTQLRKEADFRYQLGRFREHAQAVAQLGGEEEEKARLRGRLAAVVANFRDIIRVTRNLSFFTTGYNYLPQVIPAMVVAPLYISGKVEFGTVTQSAMAFSQVLAAFSLIVSQFQQLSAYAAVIRRLGGMWEATEPGQPDEGHEALGGEAPAPPSAPAPALPRRVAYDQVTLRTPEEGRMLVRDLSLEIPEGRRLVITGANGSGKTALFLATEGLWQGVQGNITCPARGEVMFLPQRPYVVGGRMRDLLVYALEQHDFSDERLLDVLRQVGLEAVVHEAGGLDVERDWHKVLSEGEQHALGFARLLLARPRFAFVDNAAGVLDGTHLERIYTALEDSSITYVSAGEHPALLAYHDLCLELLGDGEWRITPAGAAAPAAAQHLPRSSPAAPAQRRTEPAGAAEVHFSYSEEHRNGKQ
jgi:putative ATP-binding cassette transporter